MKRTLPLLAMGVLILWASNVFPGNRVEPVIPSGQKVFQLAPGDNRVTDDYGTGGSNTLAKDSAPFPEPSSPYPPNMGDGVPAEKRSYVLPCLPPFAMRYFTNEFSYGGWHTWNMTDYAATRGFRYTSKYWKRPPIKELPHLPRDTEWLHWGGFNWEQWLERRAGDPARYDYLSGRALSESDFENAFFLQDPAENHLMMIDLEHAVLPPEKLRAAPFYPRDKTAAEQADFEKRYYDGYARTYVLPVEMAHKKGWKTVGLYGWAPFGRQWGGLEKMQTLTERAAVPWELYGKKIYDAVDIIYPSVYCFYWTPENTAYILANIDANIEIVNAQKVRKPVRPYFWTLLHGGGGGWRWWQGQPLRNEEVEAQVVLSFFTGEDGIVEWNWAGTGNHIASPTVFGEKDYRYGQQMQKYNEALARYEATHKGQPPKPPFKPGFNFQVGVPFTARDWLRPAVGPVPVPLEGTMDFKRHDHIHVLEVAPDDTCSFQKVLSGKPRSNHSVPRDSGQEGARLERGKVINHGKDPSYPIYQTPRKELEERLRPLAEPVAYVFRGLALVHRYEDLLKKGEVKIDVPAHIQFRDKLPIVRRVKYGDYHLIATYDPWTEEGQPGRDITLPNFDGNPGLTVSLPSGSEVRLFVVQHASRT